MQMIQLRIITESIVCPVPIVTSAQLRRCAPPTRLAPLQTPLRNWPVFSWRLLVRASKPRVKTWACTAYFDVIVSNTPGGD